MGSTETDGAAAPQADAAPRALTPEDVPGALALSASANWNQCGADWRSMLALGQGWGLDAVAADGSKRLAASVVVLPYGSAFAWVSMVLVLPEFQRRGLAQLLLRHALGELRSRGIAAVLDATPAGHAVYVQEGFSDTWGFARYRREGAAPGVASASAIATRALRESDWPAIVALDAPAFGAKRTPLLRSLAARWPQAARVVEEGGVLRGFVFGREGREAHQIGPLVAADDRAAIGLLGAALAAAPGAVYVDLLDRRKETLLPWLAQQGFVFQRPFTRMIWGATHAPGDPANIVLAAGPELG